jgi:hybrid polyketide synthase/nonribosomal peptide synthetase ACE1
MFPRNIYQLSGEIRQVAKKHLSTPFHFHLAAVKALIHRFLGVRDVCFGVVDNCRWNDHMRAGIGPLINILPLRLKASSEQRFCDAITEARQKALLALTNSVPLEVILNELQVTRHSTHSPLVQVFVNYIENSIEDGQSFLGCQMEVMNQDQSELPYDIALTIINNVAGDVCILVGVQETLYSEYDSLLIAQGYEDILHEFVAAPEKEINDVWNFRQSKIQKALLVGRGEEFFVESECTVNYMGLIIQ